MSQFNPSEFESKWSKIWNDNKTYKTPDEPTKPKNFTLVMFPYPSGDLHIGHWYNFGPADIYARFKRMTGHTVLHPFGFDAFGLPAEGAAIKRGIHPSDWTHKNIESMKKQLEKMGPSYDWDRTVVTCDPDYYKWTQWCFLKLYEKGLAYKTRAAVNWCPLDKSVLANEQAEGGICWRCGSKVEQKMIEQWFFKITDYADRLLNDLSLIEWPEKIKSMQRNWIGKSEGSEITFDIKKESEEAPEKKQLTVFSTRPDTIYGATFLVLAPEHPRVEELTTPDQKRDINMYVEQTKHRSELERLSEGKEKTGVFTGSYALHPFTGEKLPIWISDFILASYGTGAIMAVPAHDHRDYDFAKKFDLPIKYVIQPSEITALIVDNYVDKQLFVELESAGFTFEDFSNWGKLVHFSREKVIEFQHLVQTHLRDVPTVVHMDGVVRAAIFKDRVVSYNTEEESWAQARNYGESKKIIPEHLDFTFPEEGFTAPFISSENGYLVDSGNFSGLKTKDAIELVTKVLEREGKGKKVTKYKLRDWLVSRQRYWGAPIPIIYCQKCGVVPVPEKDLPVVLPYEVDYTPQEVSPLGSSSDFVKVKCPNCAGDARRDTDTMDTFVDSSWYYLRYPTPKAENFPFGAKDLGDAKDTVNQWLPVDKYIGGAEHAVLHLLYSRFFTKFFADLGYVNFQEPFMDLFNQGTILGPDHQKMSKSKGNVINPDELVEHYGGDTVRMYMCFIGPYDQGGAWNPSGIEGVARFMRKVWHVLTGESVDAPDRDVEVALNRLIKKVTEDLPHHKYNTSVAAFMEYMNFIDQKKMTNEQKITLLKILAPFTPFVTEELWHNITGKPETESIHHEEWPQYNPELLIESEVEIAIQVAGKVRARLKIPVEWTKDQVYEATLKLEDVQKYVQGKEIVNIIYVTNKLLNIVVK
jgi:leucyl-tRNA synthetase